MISIVLTKVAIFQKSDLQINSLVFHDGAQEQLRASDIMYRPSFFLPITMRSAIDTN
jgi:hypothetical protein